MSKPFFGFHYDIARGTYLTPECFRRAVRLAAATASLKATRPGGQKGIPIRNEVEASLHEHP